MGIYVLSLSHKTTPVDIRALFAYTQEQKERVLRELTSTGLVDEAVVLATCSRMEIYCHGAREEDGFGIGERDGHGTGREDGLGIGEEGGPEKWERDILEMMERTAVKIAGAGPVKAAGAEQAEVAGTGQAEAAGAGQAPNIGRCFRRYCGQDAVHHLFRVAAGLDSMVIGEDQILSQVKQAYEFSRERGYCRVYFNTLFRDAVTGAKKVKTDTILSKTPVSTASLAVKMAEERLGGLSGKKMMIIGATGKIGGIVLKNAQDIKGLEICVTVRDHLPAENSGHDFGCEAVAYEERFRMLDEVDVVVSATASPHYTITAEQAGQSLSTQKERVFLDLAVPADLEGRIGTLPGVCYYNIDDMAEAARQNNEKKQAEIQTADQILGEYETRFYKWLLFQSGRDSVDRLKELIVREACENGIEAAVDRLFYRIREAGTAEDTAHFLASVQKVNDAETEAARQWPESRKKRKKAEQPAYFPMFFNLEHQNVLIVGAGKTASRRAEVLAEFGAEVTVVAPEGSELMERLSGEQTVRWEHRRFEAADLEGRFLVIAAVDDSKLNAEIASACREKGILVNHAGDKSQCDFYFPGIAREGGIVAGVTASGRDHKLAGEITGQMQMWLKKFAD